MIFEKSASRAGVAVGCWSPDSRWIAFKPGDWVPGLRFAIRWSRGKKKTCAGTWMSGCDLRSLSQEALIFVAHELGRKQHRGCQVDGSRQLVGEQEVGPSKE